MIWAGIGFGLVLFACIVGLVFVKPDYRKYPSGRWPR